VLPGLSKGLTIREVNSKLDEFHAFAKGVVDESDSSKTKRQHMGDILQFFFIRTTAEEQRWIIRIILNRMKLGIGERSLAHGIHPDFYNLYAVCNDLKKVCEDVAADSSRRTNFDISLFSAFTAMKLKKTLPEHIVDSMECPEFWVEEKLDGNRVIMHYHKGDFRWFGR
jgi:DNA ligase 4